MFRWQMSGFQSYFLLLWPQVLSWWPVTEREIFKWKKIQCSCYFWHWCGTLKHSKTSTSTKPNQSTPTVSLICSHPPSWTNSFSNCVADTNTLAALLPLPCYKIIYFMINFHRSLAMPLAQLGSLWGSKRPFSLLVFCGLESKANQDKLPQILPWREYFKRITLLLLSDLVLNR